MSDLVFEKLAQALAASESWRLNIAGDFFRLSEAAYPVSVSLLKGMRIVGTMRNMLAGDYVRDMEFDGVIIDNGATAQTVTAQIAGGGAGSDRVLGEVSVINGEIQKVKAGGAFIGFGNQGMVAGSFSSVQLWNTVGSGKNLILNAVAMSSAGAQWLSIHSGAVPLATLSGAGLSKSIGGAVSAGQIRIEATASIVGALLGMYGAEAINKTLDFKFSEPLLIPPGSGIKVVGQTANMQVLATFQWTEELQ